MVSQTSLWSSWNVRHIATHRDGSLFVRCVAFARALPRFLSALAARPSLVHIHMASGGSFFRKSVLMWLARVVHVPVVLHIHGGEFHQFHARLPRLMRRYVRATLEASSLVIALGEIWAHRLARLAPRARIVVLPNAVRLRQPVSQPKVGESVRVLFVGRIGEEKGAFVLLEAWAQVLRQGVLPTQLTLAGDGSIERARQLVAELGLGESVQVLGWVDPGDIPQLMSESHVLVLPSLNEGQPMAILEAMAHGMCIVASDRGGIPDLIDDDCGVLVPAGDVDGLATPLAAVVNDADLRARLGAQAAQRVIERFDIEVVVRRLDDMYSEVAR
ncbi:glycosyltransferase family 4 protein [Desertimonas flava]|uniref:glycosyltransferase family 4 protein n=1 Tax=Desertimonas flava TaxID=2064846 RepID=UPI000E340C29|nr:glycosyltransferase family 4 protein [Desertimonas flava]